MEIDKKSTKISKEKSIEKSIEPNSESSGLLIEQTVTPVELKIATGDIAFIDSDISRLRLITLTKGMNIYYGSQIKNSFDPSDIKLSDGTLLALFSNSSKLSSDVFMNCANFPVTNGYLHKFIIKKDIPYIQIISSSAIDKNSDLRTLDTQYCQRPENPKLNGFAYPIKNVSAAGLYDYIIGLCNPNEFLSYESTTICVNPYRLSEPMNIN